MSSSSTAPSRRTEVRPRPDIRLAELDDLDTLVALENRCFQTDRLSRRSFRYLLKQGHAVTHVAEIGGEIVGYVMTLFSRGTSMARIYSIAVDPVARGRGAGRLLVETAEQAASRAECRDIRLEIRRDNKASIATFTGLGYRQFGVVSDYYDDHMEALRFQKSLAPELPLELVKVPYYPQSLDFTCGPAALMMAMTAVRPGMRLNRPLELRLWREATTIFMTSGHGGCGPHGLALAAWHRGFGAEVFVNARGTLLVDTVRNPDKKEVMRLVQADMEAEMKTLGIPLRVKALGAADLEKRTAAGAVPLVLISSYRIYRERFPHWVVVTGFDEQYIFMHDPYIDVEAGETVSDCINMPVLRRDFERMARYGRSGQKAVVLIHPDQEGLCG
jgi:ribosomal protein S18 acetylase RimI-like enzyme